MNDKDEKPVDFDELRASLQADKQEGLVLGDQRMEVPSLPDLLFSSEDTETDTSATLDDLKLDLQGQDENSAPTQEEEKPVLVEIDGSFAPDAPEALSSSVSTSSTEVIEQIEYEASKLDQAEIDALARQLEERDKVKAPERHAFLTDEQIQEREARSIGRNLLPTIEHVLAPTKTKKTETVKQGSPKSLIPDIAKGKEAFFDRKSTGRSRRPLRSFLTVLFLTSYAVLLGGFVYGHHNQISEVGSNLIDAGATLSLTLGSHGFSQVPDVEEYQGVLLSDSSDHKDLATGESLEISISELNPTSNPENIDANVSEPLATDASNVPTNEPFPLDALDTTSTLVSGESLSSSSSTIEKVPSPQSCLIVQGLSRSLFTEIFRSRGDSVRAIEVKDSSVPSSYVVFLTKDRSASDSQLSALRAKGIKDTFRIPSGPLAGNLSLGLFKDEASAHRQKAIFESAGVNGLRVGPRSYIRAVDFKVESTLVNVQSIKAAIQNEPHIKMSTC